MTLQTVCERKRQGKRESESVYMFVGEIERECLLE